MLLTTALDRRSCSRVLLCSLVMLRAACAQSAPDAPPLDRAALRALVQRQGESVACVRGHSIGRWRRIGPAGEFPRRPLDSLSLSLSLLEFP
jgi:hypothetical protein